MPPALPASYPARALSRLFRSGHAYDEIRALLAGIEKKGPCLDMPGGRGPNARGIREAGFEPVSGDLSPERSHAAGVPSVRMDWNAPLPFADGRFAAALCSEGIEHHPAQLGLITEFARILQPGGSLLLTTPNVLNLRGRLAAALNGHYSFKRAPISEVTALWKSGDKTRPYVGHAHMIDYFELRFVLRQAGFTLLRVTSAKYALSALLLAPLLWAPVQLATRRLFARVRRSDPAIYREICTHALSPDLLFGKKLIVLARKG